MPRYTVSNLAVELGLSDYGSQTPEPALRPSRKASGCPTPVARLAVLHGVLGSSTLQNPFPFSPHVIEHIKQLNHFNQRGLSVLKRRLDLHLLNDLFDTVAANFEAAIAANGLCSLSAWLR